MKLGGTNFLMLYCDKCKRLLERQSTCGACGGLFCTEHKTRSKHDCVLPVSPSSTQTFWKSTEEPRSRRDFTISSKILAIDLGTINSAAALIDKGIVEIIPSIERVTIPGGKFFPSIVAFTEDGRSLVGEPARQQAFSNPTRTITAIKRKIGTGYKVRIGRKDYSSIEITALILRKIRMDAEAFLGETIKQAVITVPAYFSVYQRAATEEAGTSAGLDVLRIVPSPLAAAVAYGFETELKGNRIAVLDFGGGYFSVMMMEMGEGVFEVISYSGDTRLGGTDMDDLIIDYLLTKFKLEHGIDLKVDSMAMFRLREAAEKAKIELSTANTAEINLPYLVFDSVDPKHMNLTLTKAKLEELIEPVLERLDKPIQIALRDAKWSLGNVDKIILVGGPTRMPSVRARFTKNFGREPERGVDPMECVARGAAIIAGVLAGEVKDILHLDVTPLSIGVETLGNVFTRLIDRNTTIPTKKSEIFSTAVANQPAVEIHVLQGERARASDNITLGRFKFGGIPPAPRGVPKIELTVDIDANGNVNVSATDLGTGKKMSATMIGDSEGKGVSTFPVFTSTRPSSYSPPSYSRPTYSNQTPKQKSQSTSKPVKPTNIVLGTLAAFCIYLLMTVLVFSVSPDAIPVWGVFTFLFFGFIIAGVCATIKTNKKS